jgi:demethylmenaquinone methyltransferase/2-methoxy-6-polyprenyl-1,4-benzoquinol methylase
MFDEIAPRYDLLNHLLSAGLDRRWWRQTASTFQAALARPEAVAIDLCCGTGDMTLALDALRPKTHDAAAIIAVDFSREMLQRAERKFAGHNIQILEADALHLPLPDNSADLVTSAFGFRNLASYEDGLAEIYRVLRPGGQIGILECNQPDGLSGAFYSLYFHHVLPVLGGFISGSAGAYRYLPASVERFPRPPRMLEMMQAARFQNTVWRRYTLGAAGLYVGQKPA